MWNYEAVAYFKILPRKLPQRNEEHDENPLSTESPRAEV
jgi:hypothetical protein